MKTNKELKKEIEYYKNKTEELENQLNEVGVKGKVGYCYYNNFGDRPKDFIIISGFNKKKYQMLSIGNDSNGKINKVYPKEDDFEFYKNYFGSSNRKSHRIDSDFIDNLEKSCNAMLSRVRDEIRVKLMDREGLTKNQAKFIGRFYRILADDSYMLVCDYLDKFKEPKGFRFNEEGEIFTKTTTDRVTFLDDSDSVEISESEFLNQFNQTVGVIRSKLLASISIEKQ